MDIRQLRHFIAVAEEKHFCRAASRLNIDPAPLSRSIKALETNLGTQLFNRNSKKTTLTKEGEIFFKGVQHMLSIYHDVERKIHAISDGYESFIHIGLSDGLNIGFLSEMLRIHRQEYPLIHVKAEKTTMDELTTGLLNRTYNVCITRSKIQSDEIICETISKNSPTDELIVLLPLRHPLLNNEQITINDLVNNHIVCLHSMYTGYFSQVKEFLLHRQTELEIEHVPCYDLMLILVSAGFAIGLVDYSMYSNMKNDRVIVRRLTEPAYLKMYLCYHQRTNISLLRYITNNINY